MRRRTVEDSPIHTLQPGEYIPTSTADQSSEDVRALFSEMQQSITSELQKVLDSVSLLGNRLTKVENEVKNLKDRGISGASASIEAEIPLSGHAKRKRQTPVALSVCDIFKIILGYHVSFFFFFRIWYALFIRI